MENFIVIFSGSVVEATKIMTKKQHFACILGNCMTVSAWHSIHRAASTNIVLEKHSSFQ